jgi:hypothetical protein
LDPELLKALDEKRARERQTRSEFIREAIFQSVRDLGTVTRDVIYPQDRVGKSRGGRPKKLKAVEEKKRA